MPDELAFKDPHKGQPVTVKTVALRELEVIGHQRKPRKTHLEHLSASIERMGFIVPLVVVERDGGYSIIDGQHRFTAGKKLGLKEFPVVVVPGSLARKMMSLNVEKDLNIRERSAIALSIYRDMLEENGARKEDHAEVVDALEHAHLATLGLAYEKSGRLAGSSFEPLLKRCDTFLSKKLEDAYPVREARGARVIEAAEQTKVIADKLKEMGHYNSFVGQQILSYANPLKRTRKPAEFDPTFDKLMKKLAELEEKPEKALREPVGE
jgi:ParB family chromosome partitioning protein